MFRQLALSTELNLIINVRPCTSGMIVLMGDGITQVEGEQSTDLQTLLLRSEIMDSMWKPSKFDRVYPFSTAFTFFVTVPHSILSVLAFGKANVKQCTNQPLPPKLCATLRPNVAVHSSLSTC